MKEEEENNHDEEEETEERVGGSTVYHCSLLEDALSMVDRKTGSIFPSLALENSSSTASFGGSAQAEWEMYVD